MSEGKLSAKGTRIVTALAPFTDRSVAAMPSSMASLLPIFTTARVWFGWIVRLSRTWPRGMSVYTNG